MAMADGAPPLLANCYKNHNTISPQTEHQRNSRPSAVASLATSDSGPSVPYALLVVLVRPGAAARCTTPWLRGYAPLSHTRPRALNHGSLFARTQQQLQHLQQPQQQLQQPPSSFFFTTTGGGCLVVTTTGGAAAGTREATGSGLAGAAVRFMTCGAGAEAGFESFGLPAGQGTILPLLKRWYAMM